MRPVITLFAKPLVVSIATLACIAGPTNAWAATSDTSASSKSSDWWSTSDGWKKDRVWYTDKAADLPTGQWDDQFMNSFAGVAVGGAGWHTWSFLAKPNAAGWSGTYDSNPYPHVDTSAAGSTAKNWTQLQLYKGFFGGYYALKYTKSNANAVKKVDNPTIAATRITDPWTMPAPSTGEWSVGMDYSQFGLFDSVAADGSLFASYGLTLNPSFGSPVAYNLLSLTIGADGTGVVTSALNGNDAETSGSLVASQLNGVLLLDGSVVTPAQATASLLTHYSPTTGWNLNPNGYEVTTFHPDDSAHTGSVFSLSARVFLDPSASSVTVSTVDGSMAVAAIPEPRSVALLSAGLGLLVLVVRRSARARAAAPPPACAAG